MPRQAHAPALVHGLDLLQRLRGQWKSLDVLAQETGLAKSSLLRLLDTLVELGLVQRDAQTKAYQGLMRLVPVTETQTDFHDLVRTELAQLCDTCEQTAEWWEPREQGMTLCQRAAKSDSEVQIRARIGAVVLAQKLEAVALLGRSCFGIHPPRDARCFTWDDTGKQVFPPVKQVKALLDEARSGHWVDRQPNAIGVRRIAQVIRHETGLVGVLCLAVPIRPWIADLATTYNTALQAAAQRLSRSHASESPS